MTVSKNQKEDYKDLRRKIADHGTEQIEVILDPIPGIPENLPDGQQRSKKATRTVLMLEMLFRKGFYKENLGAAQQYLDRVLGKPKESLSLTDESDGFGKLNDDQLIQRIFKLFTESLSEKQIAAAIKAVGKRGAGIPPEGT